MAIRQIQSTFSFGELDPKLLARVDFANYYKGARKLRNVLSIPQGGIKRRFGTLFADTIRDEETVDDPPITDPTEVNGVIFDFSPEKTFVIVVRPSDRAGAAEVAFDIYLNDVVQSIETTPDYAITDIANLRFLRGQDRIIVLHESFTPKELVRGATDANWTLADLVFANQPVYDYSIIDGTTYRAAAQTLTLGALTGLGISLTGSAASFTSAHVGGLLIAEGGIARITAVATTVDATVDIFEDFTNLIIKGVNALLMEVAWGDNSSTAPNSAADRGFPSRGTFFQNRMVLANSLALNNLVWASVTGDFLNFDDSGSEALEGFSLGLGANGNEEVQTIVGTKALLAFGFSGVYASSLFVDTPMTPGNAFLNEQSRDGSADIEAQIVDNQVFFVDQNGQQVRTAQYDISSSSFDVIDASIFSPQLITNPVSTASFSPDNDDGSFYLLVNTEGTLTVFQSLFKQEVASWTQAETRGSFKQVLASRDTGYVIVRRTVSTGATVTGFATNIYTTNENFEVFTDITTAAQSAATDLPIFTNDGDYLLIGHESPFFRIDVVHDTLANTSILPTFEYLNNLGTWTAFTPTDGTTGFSADGEINWDLDADTEDWFPQDLEAIENVTLPADTVDPPINKFWMRIKRVNPGPIDIGFTVDSAFAVFTNVTDALADPADDVTLFSADNEYLLVGHATSFAILNVALNTVASADIVATFEFLDSSGTWVTFAPTDNTTGFTGAGSITWTIANLTDWAAMTVNGNTDKFWIRIRRTVDALVTPPIEDTIFLNIVTAPVEETILFNVGDRLTLESIDCDLCTDATEPTTSSDANGLVTGLDHLLGQQVYALVDGVPEGPFFVDNSGEITVAGVSSSDVKVGINYIPTIVPMPLVVQEQFGQNVYQPKHLKAIYIDFFESLGITVNGFEIPTLSLNNFALDQTPVPATGVYETTPMGGWNARGINTISQSLPLPMTIIGIGYRLEIS